MPDQPTPPRPLGNGDLNLPFDLAPPGQTLDLSDAFLSGGLVVIACAVPVDDAMRPALAFRFLDPTGEFYTPMLLIADVEDLQQLPALVTQSCEHAIRAAAG